MVVEGNGKERQDCTEAKVKLNTVMKKLNLVRPRFQKSVVEGILSSFFLGIVNILIDLIVELFFLIIKTFDNQTEI